MTARLARGPEYESGFRITELQEHYVHDDRLHRHGRHLGHLRGISLQLTDDQG